MQEAFPDHSRDFPVSELNICSEMHTCLHLVANVYTVPPLDLRVCFPQHLCKQHEMGEMYLLIPLNPPRQQTSDLGKHLWACAQHINHLGRGRSAGHPAEDRWRLCLPVSPDLLLLRKHDEAGLAGPDSNHQEPGRHPPTLTGRGASRRWA